VLGYLRPHDKDFKHRGHPKHPKFLQISANMPVLRIRTELKPLDRRPHAKQRRTPPTHAPKIKVPVAPTQKRRDLKEEQNVVRVEDRMLRGERRPSDLMKSLNLRGAAVASMPVMTSPVQ